MTQKSLRNPKILARGSATIFSEDNRAPMTGLV